MFRKKKHSNTIITILTVTKNDDFTLSLENIVWENPRGRGQVDSLSLAFLGLKIFVFLHGRLDYSTYIYFYKHFKDFFQ